jgi:hypothetical protein
VLERLTSLEGPPFLGVNGTAIECAGPLRLRQSNDGLPSRGCHALATCDIPSSRAGSATKRPFLTQSTSERFAAVTQMEDAAGRQEEQDPLFGVRVLSRHKGARGSVAVSQWAELAQDGASEMPETGPSI